MASQCFKCEVLFPNNAKDIISCMACGNFFHPTCTRIGSLVNFGKMGSKKSKWRCDGCKTGGSASGGSSSNVSIATDEEPKNSEILDQIRQLQAQMTHQLEDRFSIFQGEFDALKATLSSMKESMDLLNQENKELKDKCKVLEDHNSYLRDELVSLKEEVRDLQQYSRKDNLEIVGVPATQGENIDAVMESVAKAVGVEYKAEDISVAHRLSKSKKNTHPTVIVKFTSRSAKMKWWSAAKQKKIKASDLHSSLPGTPVYLNDHLTAHNKAVLGKAKRLVREKRLAFAWVNSCRVLVRATPDSQVRHVACFEDLDSLLGETGRPGSN